MGLLVNTYTGEGATFQNVEVEHSEELFGFENCRQRLWGHPVMSHLGISLLPSLRETNVCVEGEALLAQLESEARLILSSLGQVAADTEHDAEFITFRLQNLLRAVARARELGGGVYIG